MRWSQRIHTVMLVSAIVVAGCSTEPSAPLPSEPRAAPAIAPPRLHVSWLPPEVVIGTTAMALLSAFDSAWNPLELPSVRWSSSDTSVVAIGQASQHAAQMEARSVGTSLVSAEALGATRRQQVVVYSRPTQVTVPDSAPIEIADFSVGVLSESYNFVPQARLRAKGNTTLMLLEMELEVAGVPPIAPCATSRVVTVVPRPLVGEVYGDWELEFGAPGLWDPEAEATLRIIVRDRDAKTWLVEARGPLRNLEPPASYTGGPITPWSCAIRATPP